MMKAVETWKVLETLALLAPSNVTGEWILRG